MIEPTSAYHLLYPELHRLYAEQREWHTRDGARARGYRRGLRFRVAELLAELRERAPAPAMRRARPSSAMLAAIVGLATMVPVHRR